jgi:DNA-binding NtrC family response regulator
MKVKKVLVIDDEKVVLDSVKKILLDEGYEVEVNLSGRDGLKDALQSHYDIVLTDIRMPDIGGMRVLRDIKRAKPSLPVIMITGYASVKSSVQAMKLGASDYVEKPFTPDQLIKAVDTALETAASRKPEPQELIHKQEMIKVLERASSDNEFFNDLLENGIDALDEYELTGPEKLALATRDIFWIEQQMGHLTRPQKRWLELKRIDDIW